MLGEIPQNTHRNQKEVVYKLLVLYQIPNRNKLFGTLKTLKKNAVIFWGHSTTTLSIKWK